MKLHVKSDNEIAALQAKLDTLKGEQAQKAQKATEAQQAQIDDVERKLTEAQKAQWDARAERHAAEQAQVRADYDATVQAIVECAAELRDLCAAYDERIKQCVAVGIRTLPQTHIKPLQATVLATFAQWDRSTNLTGKAHERESTERRAVRNAETQLAHTQRLWDDAKARVENYKGSRGDQMAIEMMKRLDALTKSLALQRHNVTEALLGLGSEATMQDRERLLEMQEGEKAKVVLSW